MIFGLFTTSVVAKIAPVLLPLLKEALLKKGTEAIAGKATEGISGWVGKKWTEWQERRHLAQALEKAEHKDAVKFELGEERDQYRDILKVLSQSPHNKTLCQEAVRLLKPFESPNFQELSRIYNSSRRITRLRQTQPIKEIDVKPYLDSFFDALIIELSSDELFKQKVSMALADRANKTIVENEPQIAKNTLLTAKSSERTAEILEHAFPIYTDERYKQDLQEYAEYLTTVYHRLELPDVDPQTKNKYPELEAIFVPQSVEIPGQAALYDTIVSALESSPNLVLLGKPGSGKSTATYYLTWGHARTRGPNPPASPGDVRLLSGTPLPLRIKLSELHQERVLGHNYDFFSYVIETQLKRNQRSINAEMFDRLLKEKSLLFLFDGLDEIADSTERMKLRDEIRTFAENYSGNRFLVTSRSLGDESGNFPYPLFSIAHLLEFNDTQINDFLHRWYTVVLKHSSLSSKDQEELRSLYTTLTGKPQLHALARNPLLLTIITNLHSRQPLPNKRVKVYDVCADWLLEKWAVRRATHKRLDAMQMTESVQRESIAHIGFVLHEQAQTSDRGPSGTETTSTESYVTHRIMENAIVNLLERRNFFSPGDRQREADLFLQLIQEETGLIAGQEEDGEKLYGFVHNTFQEYFAAVDIYNQQDDPPSGKDADVILTEFLTAHLHDPHWQEVILLLFGKLKPGRATRQLQQLLSEENKGCLRSRYKRIVEQDLFFACTCLSEDIMVEHTLDVEIISRISNLVKNSPFPSQRARALEALSSLIQIPRYTALVLEKLMTLVAKNTVPDNLTRIWVAQTLYRYSSANSQEQAQALQTLRELTGPAIPLEDTTEAAQALYQCYPAGSQERMEETRMLLDRAQRADVPFDATLQTIQKIRLFLQKPTARSEEEQIAIQALLDLADRSDISSAHLQSVVDALLPSAERNTLAEWEKAAEKLLKRVKESSSSFEENVEAAYTLYQGPVGSAGRREGTKLLLSFIQPDPPFEQAMDIAQALYWRGPDELDERTQVIAMLSNLEKQPEVSFEQRIQITEALYRSNPDKSEERREAAEKLMRLAQLSSLTYEQSMLIARTLYGISLPKSREWLQATQMLIVLVRLPSTSVEQILQIIQLLFNSRSSDPKAEEVQQALQKLSKLALQPDLTLEEQMQVAQVLYQNSSFKSEERQQAARLLSKLAEDSRLSKDQRLQVATFPITVADSSYGDRVQAVRTTLTLLQGEDAKQQFGKYWRSPSPLNKPELSDIQHIDELAQQEMLPTNVRDEMYVVLRTMVPLFDKITTLTS